MSGRHGHIGGGNEKVALPVAVLATLLAASETTGRRHQTHALSEQITAPNLWSFFQAGWPQIETWRKTAQRCESEPNEGQKELAAPAKAKEESRDRALAAYHMFEHGSAAFQLAIVLADASALTMVAWLMLLSTAWEQSASLSAFSDLSRRSASIFDGA